MIAARDVETKMTRQTVQITTDTLIALKTLSVISGKTQDEIMRTAIEEYLRQQAKGTSKR